MTTPAGFEPAPVGSKPTVLPAKLWGYVYLPCVSPVFRTVKPSCLISLYNLRPAIPTAHPHTLGHKATTSGLSCIALFVTFIHLVRFSIFEVGTYFAHTQLFGNS